MPRPRFFVSYSLLFASFALRYTVHAEEPFEVFLKTHCIHCHGPEKEKGDLRIDQLSRDFKLGADTHHWAEVIEQVNSGEMPPKKEKQADAGGNRGVCDESRCAHQGRPCGAHGGAAGGGALSAEPERVSKHGL